MRIPPQAWLWPLLIVFLPGPGVGVAAEPARSPAPSPAVNPPIHIAFLWHMHQPIYWPYESVTQTEANGRYGYSVVDIHNQRTGPYTSWPKDAVQMGINAGMPHFGAQVSFSGSVVENLNALEAAGNGNFQGWKNSWNTIKNQNTSLGNPRLDLVGFGYHHPLLGLIEPLDIRKQIQSHRTLFATQFPGTYSRGFFPAETAFSPRIIPALVAEGIQWVLVDNIHFERACAGYPYNSGGNLVEPNRAEVRNADPGDWRALTGVWAPTPVSARWGHQPHVAEAIDPATGAATRITVVPADRYLGNEDGRGGFGALNYEGVLSQLEAYNTDPAHPLLVVLHHDGDNYGGGSDAYYHNNFQSFVNWLASNPTRFVCTTIEDYLEQFPPNPADVIHVEDGSWSGADNGDPEFKKWLGDPGAGGYSPDRNSWAVVTAARNFIGTAEAVNSASASTKEAWRLFLNAEASDYWYWDGSQGGVWDSHPTRAANMAVPYAQTVISGQTDAVGPTLFLPQREPYNPGEKEWGAVQPADFEVWTYAFDVSGLSRVELKVRSDLDGSNPTASAQNETYAGGAEVTAWTTLAMTASDVPSQTNPLPLFRAPRYAATLTGYRSVLLDYYVEAADTRGNVSRSPIRHVWVGSGSGGGGNPGTVSWIPANPGASETIMITVVNPGKTGTLHWGVNGWQNPVAAYRPAGTTLWNGTGPVVETPLAASGPNLVLTLGPFNNPAQSVSTLDFVIHYDDNTWDNHGGGDYHVTVAGAPVPYVMDGALDAGADLLAANAGVSLYVDWNGSDLYLATQAAGPLADDVFLYVSADPSVLVAAPWAKSGQVGAWAAYVGNETSNNWAGWFDQTAPVGVSAGTFVEGTLRLATELGSLPSVVYVAAVRYQDADGGALTVQAPAGDGDGLLEAPEYYAFSLATTGVDPGALSPRLAASPNPFRSRTTISYSLDAAGLVTVDVLDVRGRLVSRLEEGTREPGVHRVSWAGRDEGGRRLAAGLYMVRVATPAGLQTRKLLLLP